MVKNMKIYYKRIYFKSSEKKNKQQTPLSS